MPQFQWKIIVRWMPDDELGITIERTKRNEIDLADFIYQELVRYFTF